MSPNGRLGLTASQWDEVRLHLVEPLRAQGAQVWCFGSRARGDHRPFSDLDLLVEGAKDLAPLLAQIRERFEKSNFPIKIDLVEKSQFAASYLPGFERDKVEL